jgi:hypothetical protein
MRYFDEDKHPREMLSLDPRWGENVDEGFPKQIINGSKVVRYHVRDKQQDLPEFGALFAHPISPLYLHQMHTQPYSFFLCKCSQ